MPDSANITDADQATSQQAPGTLSPLVVLPGGNEPSDKGVIARRNWFFRRRDGIIRVILMLIALSGISSLALITGFILWEGLPRMIKIGVGNFLFSDQWYPSEKPALFGIAHMIVGSLIVTGGAMILGGLLGLGCAVVLTQFCPRRVVDIIKPGVELLAGIPSVVFGFIGVMILVPVIRECFGGWGLGVLASSIVLGIMIVPTVTSISVDALRAVPRGYREGSIALGATQWQTTRMVIIKASRSGIVAAIILGMGRAVGETMAVIMVAGNTNMMPHSILDPMRTLTSNIALEMGYSAGAHREALFSTGVVLFVIIMILNTIALTVSRRRSQKAGGK